MNITTTAREIASALTKMPNDDQPWFDKEDRKLIQGAKKAMRKFLDKNGFEFSGNGNRVQKVKANKAQEAYIKKYNELMEKLHAIALTEAEETVRTVTLLVLKQYPDADAAKVKDTIKFATQVALNEPLNLSNIFKSVWTTLEIKVLEANRPYFTMHV